MVKNEEIQLKTKFGLASWGEGSLQISTPVGTKVVVDGIPYAPVVNGVQYPSVNAVEHSLSDSLADGWTNEFGKLSWKKGAISVSAPKETKIVVNGVEYKPIDDSASIFVDPQVAYTFGDTLRDGWVAACISPTTGEPLSVEPARGALEGYQTWNAGREHAVQLREVGNKNARLPDSDELQAIYNLIVVAGRNQNAQFDISEAGKYWSSKVIHDSSMSAQVRYFDDGFSRPYSMSEAHAYARIVRDEPGLKLA